MIALLALSVSSWATPTTITWDQTDVASIDVYSMDGSPATSVQRLKGITLTGTTSVSGDYAGFYTYEGNTSISESNGGTLTFSSALYQILSIVINYDDEHGGYGYAESPTQWIPLYATLSWTGSATHSVELANAHVGHITSIEFTVEAIPTTTVTWDQTDIETINLSCPDVDDVATSSAISGITASLTRTSSGSYAYCQFSGREIWISDCGELTFTSSGGDIVGIVINGDKSQYCSGYNLSTDWTYDSNDKTFTWEGTASSQVTLSGGIDIYATSIEFTLASSTPAPVSSTITWDQSDVASIHVFQNSGYEEPQSQTVKEISVTAAAPASGDYSQFFTYENNSYLSVEVGGTLTFTAPEDNKLTRIIVSCGTTPSYPENVSDGWTWNDQTYKLVWSGDAASSVTLACNGSTGTIYFSSITSVEFTVVEDVAPVTPTPTTTTIEWDNTEVCSITLKCDNVDDVQTTSEIDGITASLKRTSAGGNCEFRNSGDLWISNDCGEITFTSSVGEITGIVLYAGSQVYTQPYNLPAGWTWDSEAKTLSWEGTAAEAVTLSGSMDFLVASIEFTVVTSAAPVDPSGSTITWDSDDLATISIYRRDGEGYAAPSATVKTVTAITDAPAYGDYCHLYHNEYGSSISVQKGGSLTFSLESGNFTRIVIDCGSYPNNPSNVSAGWIWDNTEAQLIWSGTAASSVTLECNDKTGGNSYDLYFNIYSIEFTVVDNSTPVVPTPTDPSFTWQAQQINHVSLYPQSVSDTETTPVIKNVITSLTRTGNGEFCRFDNEEIVISNCGELTFQSIVGDITGIVITCNTADYTDADDLPADWTYNSSAGTLTWAGTAAAEVTLSGTLNITLTSIEFSYSPAAAPYLDNQFYYNGLSYIITGAQTAKIAPQYHEGTVIIRSTVEYLGDTYYVTEIAENAFRNQVEVSNVMSMNDGGANLAKIGAHAFDGCIRMDEVSLNSTVLDEIGDEAFKDCKLMTIFECYTEQSSVLGSNAFSGDTYLNHIYVNEYSVNDYKAATCWSAYTSKITAMDALPSVGEQFFYHDQNATGIYQVTSAWPRKVKVLPYTNEVNAIYPRTLEGTLVIPEEVTYIHNQYSITGIGAEAYKGCTDIDMVLMPLAVKSIESGAFLNCTGVEKVFFLWDDPTTVTWADGTVGADFKTAASGNTQIFVPAGRLAEYQEWAPAWASCMVEGELFDITATTDPNSNSRHYRTFYSSTTDYMLPPSVNAFAGIVSNGEFLIWPIVLSGQILPRGTAVVLESETPTYRLIPTGNTAPLYTGENALQGTDVDIPRTSVGNDGENVYVLGKQAILNEELQVGMGLYKYTGTTLGAHKAYMFYDAPSGSGSSGQQNAPARFLFRHEDHATDVENVDVQSDNAPCSKILRDGQLIIIKDGKEYNAQGFIVK